MEIHPTNGVLVSVDSNHVWFEPGSLKSLQPLKPVLGAEHNPERLLPNSLAIVVEGEYKGMTGNIEFFKGD